jgi:serine/threonine-protein kinase
MGPQAGAISFEALAEIAVGATARVDLCKVLPPHPRQGQLLAVKRLHPHIAEDPTFVNQFLDEVWMTASLRHPHVVEVAGWGTDEQGSYLAVELVQGVSLLRLMKTIFDTGEAFTERMVVYLGSCICRGLAAAHALRSQSGELLNLVHRDLTPGNVLLGFNGEVKIADFGMAKAKQRLTKTLTGMKKGEPTYMAPEAARSDTIDGRADLFSFGVLLFELFAGRRPWTGKSDVEMVQATLRDPPADLRELRPKIDRELVNVVNRCLEKDPASRYQSAQEIADRFQEWLTVHGYQEGNEEALARFVRRNAMRQMRWFERAISGELVPRPEGREPPRVPTYTEHTQGHADGRDPEPPRPQIPAPPRIATPVPPPPGRGAARPAPPRATPVDPRTLRAQAAVQQLKKLAPAPEPPRARDRGRLPTLDEGDDGDETDVELRVGVVHQHAQAPRIVDADDEETGEEQPTLVQKGDAQLTAMRAEARKQQAARSKPPYVSPGLIVDEDSDQRITAVKQEKQRAGAPGVISIVDPESDLPTEPIQSKKPGYSRPETAETPIVGKGKAPPGKPLIPPAPDIPPRPFPGVLPPPAGAAKPEFAMVPRTPPSAFPPAHTDTQQSGAPYSAPVPLVNKLPPVPPPSAPMDPSRVSQPDDVQVIDRNVLRQQVLHTEEGLVAEADRLAIEAVRRNEEARAAQIRAERKAHAAKMAAEAARIAAEAVQMIRTAGVAAAAKRLEQAHAVEQGLTGGAQGGFPGGADATADPTGQSRASTFPEPPRATTYTAGFPGVDAARAMAITGSVMPGSMPPPPTSQVPPPPTGYDGRPSTVPGFESSGPYAMGPASAPTPGSGVQMAPPPVPVPGADADAFAARLKPSILGLPSGVVVGLAVGAVFLVIVLALMLAK